MNIYLNSDGKHVIDGEGNLLITRHGSGIRYREVKNLIVKNWTIWGIGKTFNRVLAKTEGRGE